MGPLLEFKIATEVGGREGAKERELEWEQRNDRVGRSCLGICRISQTQGETPNVADYTLTDVILLLPILICCFSITSVQLLPNGVRSERLHVRSFLL